MPDFRYTPMLPQQRADTTSYRRLQIEGIEPLVVDSHDALRIPPHALTTLAFEAFKDISHLLRTTHVEQVAAILDDPQASANDRFVATELLRNAHISAAGVLPMCQDTGTAIVHADRGRFAITDGHDAEHLSRGIYDAYTTLDLRYSQMAPTGIVDEYNTGTNLPAQIEIAAEGEDSYEFLFMAKGCGSANKSLLFQQTAALLSSRDRLLEFIVEQAAAIGTSACPPYHLAVVVGGTTAEYAVKTAKLASTHYLDDTVTTPSGAGYRDIELETELLTRMHLLGIGAQFGGKYFCHDVRVIRLPRHGGSLPIALAVSCAADRQARARITRDGVYLEQLERDPGRLLPDTLTDELSSDTIHIDLDQPMDAIRAQLSGHPVGTRLALTGSMVVARDLAHARIKARLDAGEPMPAYLRDHPVYYAGPAKKPEGLPSGSFGPTTAGRMDSYVDQFQAAGGSMIMLAKGNRAPAVADACRRYGGFYLGSIGGPAARLAHDCITDIECLEYPELGMEAVLRIQVENFPAFIVIDDQGNDFYRKTRLLTLAPPRRA
ncbi:fumarate hydratase C-terminal domain-containing protein [Nocardia beijingensis]|uniref:FumA C-terminus/TtdB family hydratase beta subunit n=1 Tax=Nocardia beijingensis TaxID=95162 RepID=UPI001894CB6C|nr:FumA C-terminus/TtdB family hydratase beta subunit [Nocardia beijingensis]MBF6073844.1 fumarate hydratase C-terminal domain-containing protein [Nocardia beijingensis]